MEAKDTKVGHFYSTAGNYADSSTFIVGYPDRVRDSIHVWIRGDKDQYFFDRHIYNDTEIKETDIDEETCRIAIINVFDVEDDYFAKFF